MGKFMEFKGIKKGLERIVKLVDTGKKKIEPGIDKILTVGAANTGFVYGASELIDRSDFSDPTNGLIMLTSGATLAGGNYLSLKSQKTKGLRNLARRVNSAIDKIRPFSWLKTGLLATAIATSSHQLKPYAEQVIEDFRPNGVETVITPYSNEESLSLYERLGYSPLIEHDFTGTDLAPKSSTIGRIQRTLRWQPIYNSIEDVYGIPKNTLGGMMMQESYGDPVQPNAGNDGGLGVVHVQGPTAQRYGMEIFGSSNRSSDKDHGNQIRQMLEECNYDPACAQEYDDRAHLIKVLDVAARIVTEGKNRHGNWDYGIEYYRAPARVGRSLTWRYLRDIKNWRGSLENENLLAQASRDFEQRNGYPFREYLEGWHEMSNNWGLQDYKAERN
jgi:hypothetical protein